MHVNSEFLSCVLQLGIFIFDLNQVFYQGANVGHLFLERRLEYRLNGHKGDLFLV
jgi:hypothetical protein